MTFDDFRNANVKRSQSTNGFNHQLYDWTEAEWGNAIAGETGELCNLLKKRLRGEDIPLVDVADEIADIITYVDLLSARLGISLEESLRLKFNKVSTRKGYKIFL